MPPRMVRKTSGASSGAVKRTGARATRGRPAGAPVETEKIAQEETVVMTTEVAPPEPDPVPDANGSVGTPLSICPCFNHGGFLFMSSLSNVRILIFLAALRVFPCTGTITSASPFLLRFLLSLFGIPRRCVSHFSPIRILVIHTCRCTIWYAVIA